MSELEGKLVLSNGREFRGVRFGDQSDCAAEVVFNTAMSGYQEIVSDPSYAGQMVVMTAPHIGNTGVCDEDMEAQRVFCKGLIVREESPIASNWRSEKSLGDFLREHSVAGLSGVDTRALTRALRSEGAMKGMIVGVARSTDEVLSLIASTPDMEGQNLASVVSTQTPYTFEEGPWRAKDDDSAAHRPGGAKHRIIAMDFGIKRNILRELVGVGCQVEVVPASMSAQEILKREPEGIFLSNGPGDPAAVSNAVETIAELVMSNTPVFGICLGHQLLSLALGAKTFKLPFGHHGGNHPVKDLRTGKVEITSQNHGFAVDANSLPSNLRVTHLNLYDQTVEGVELVDSPVFGIQYHPEASPGPHDAWYLFQRFVERVDAMRS